MTTTTDPIRITYDDEKHLYTLDGEAVPSVTQVLEATEAKPALPWWGMRVGLAAAVGLMQRGDWAQLAAANEPKEIIEGVPAKGREHFTAKDRKQAKPKTFIEAQTIDQRLTTNHVKEEAGDRGTAIHAALEALGEDVLPNIDEFPAEQQGYVAALSAWWLDNEPSFEEMEVIVGSRRLRYAGRFDLVVTYGAGPHQGKRCLVDLKTSKRVYTSHLKQLTGYEVAYVEMDLGEPFDLKQVLHVGRDTGLPTLCTIPAGYASDEWELSVQLFHAQQRNLACLKAAKPAGLEL